MPPFKAIIVRFANDIAHRAIESVMREFPFEYAVSLGFRPRTYVPLPADRQQWIDSSDARGGRYTGLSTADLLPLDAGLIEDMRGCEAVFMRMISRLEFARDISYDERRRLYHRHLQIWNDVIERQSINLFLSGIMPHEIPDYLIYCLCKRKGIPTLIVHASPIRDRAFLIEDWEISETEVRDRYQELVDAGTTEVTLTPQFEEYFRKQTEPSGKPAISFRRPTVLERIIMSAKKDLPGALVALLRWLPTLVSFSVWKRRFQKIAWRLKKRHMRAFYDAHVAQPDFSARYIYVPLHYQPECSTCPMGGAFDDQLVGVQLLSSCVPEGVLLYVKEHPAQWQKGYAYRDMDFYRKLSELHNVRLMASGIDSFKLREHCAAVATVTGTAGFEALFRGKPVIMFGHRFYQYAPGVFQIRTIRDCRDAVTAIFDKGVRPDPKHVRVFLKAVEDESFPVSVTDWHQLQASCLSPSENHDAIVSMLKSRIGRLS